MGHACKLWLYNMTSWEEKRGTNVGEQKEEERRKRPIIYWVNVVSLAWWFGVKPSSVLALLHCCLFYFVTHWKVSTEIRLFPVICQAVVSYLLMILPSRSQRMSLFPTHDLPSTPKQINFNSWVHVSIDMYIYNLRALSCPTAPFPLPSHLGLGAGEEGK